MNYELFTRIFRMHADGYSLRHLEEVTLVSAPTLSRLSRGTRPDLDTFFALCAWMDTSPAVFLLNHVDGAPCPNCQLLRTKLEQVQAIAQEALT